MRETIVLEEGDAIVAEQLVLRQADLGRELKRQQEQIQLTARAFERARQARLGFAQMLAKQRELGDAEWDVRVYDDKTIRLVIVSEARENVEGGHVEH